MSRILFAHGYALARLRLPLVLFGCMTFLRVPASGQPLAPEAIHGLIIAGTEHAGRQEYSRSRKAFAEAIRIAPQHPAGYLNMAILHQVMSLDFETPVPQPDYDKLLETTERLALRMLEKDAEDVQGLYYLGMMHSYTAYHKFRDGENWISGLRHGLLAAGRLERALRKSPRSYDAMTALGTYKYWKSKRMSFLTCTALVDDERNAGIRMLTTAERHATYTSAQATNSLIWIFIEEKRYAEAIKTARAVLQTFPRNRLFLWGLASAAEKLEDWRAALDAYERILSSLDSEASEPRYIELQARAKIARMRQQLGDLKGARSEAERVLANRSVDLSVFTSDGASRIRRRIDDMLELKKELNF